MIIKYPKCQSNNPNGDKICQCFAIEGPQTFFQNLDFWFENKPSGSPGQQSDAFRCSKTSRAISQNTHTVAFIDLII
jgi:hypothetical protein